ncbi:MAG: helix-turn-helix domain-containing protein [Stackebrandtia sp.]
MSEAAEDETRSTPVPSNGSPTVRRRRLGAVLREWRQRSDVSVETVAEAFDVTPSTIYRMELGRVGVKSRDIDLFVKLYGIEDEDLVKELTSLAKQGNKRGWWAKFSDTMSPPYATYVGLEADAANLYIYDGLIVNGLLQTRAYAEATFDFAKGKAKQHKERRIDLRMERQDRLSQKKDLHIWNVIDEAAIRRVVGGKDVMRAQLDHLLTLAQLPNVTLQVLPFAGGAYPGMLSSFTLMEFGDVDDEDPDYRHPNVVYIEGHTADVYEEEEVEPFRNVFEHLRAAALSPMLSVEMIRKVADDELGQ